MLFPITVSNTLPAPELSPVVLVEGALDVPELELDPDEPDDERDELADEDEEAVGGGDGNERETLGEAMLQNCWERDSALFSSEAHIEETQSTMAVVKRVILNR